MTVDTRKIRGWNKILPLQETQPLNENYLLDTGPLSGKLPDVLRFQLQEANHTLTIAVRPDILIGRHDPTMAIRPDIDLAPFQGYRHGVSRRHAIIFSRHNRLFIRSLNTTNGTSVNSRLLAPGQEYPLHDGDELMIGSLCMRVSFVEVAAPTG